MKILKESHLVEVWQKKKYANWKTFDISFKPHWITYKLENLSKCIYSKMFNVETICLDLVNKPDTSFTCYFIKWTLRFNRKINTNTIFSRKWICLPLISSDCALWVEKDIQNYAVHTLYFLLHANIGTLITVNS